MTERSETSSIRQKDMISILKTIQLTASISITISIFLVYPGVMAFFTSSVVFFHIGSNWRYL